MSRQFDPQKHHRRSIRLAGWDYTTPALYFITICTYQRQNLFTDDTFASMAQYAWQAIPSHKHAVHVALDEWVVMPNHVHGIHILTDRLRTVENELTEERSDLDDETAVPGVLPFDTRYVVQPEKDDGSGHSAVKGMPANAPPGSLGVVVGNFKSLVTRRINKVRGTQGAAVWQRGYYDHIVRNERELTRIRRYILDNPRRWTEDRENLDALVAKMRLVV